MAFFLGLVLGIIAGLALVIAFLRFENSRSQCRRELLPIFLSKFVGFVIDEKEQISCFDGFDFATAYVPFIFFNLDIFLGVEAIHVPPRTASRTDKKYVYFLMQADIVAASAGMTIEELRKILPGELRPSWLKWLNQELIKIWPYVNEATSELIRISVEPILEQYRPAILDSLKFSKLTLGTVAPQLTGVSMIEDDESAITMELELQWDGNPNIVLDIQTKLGVALPIQVKDISFTGVLCLIFKPLVEVFPCFGAVSYSLREKKKLDFMLKVIGGELSSVPGISGAIEETIQNAIEDSITWPARKVVPVLPGDYSDLELKPVGKLEVKLVQARNLTNKDIIRKTDPFAVLYTRPSNNLNPIWNEHFEFVVEDAATQHLVVKIYDDDGFQSSEFIGCAQVMLKDLQPGKVKDVWLKLVKDLEIQKDKKDRGQVHLELLYFPFGMESELSNPFSSQFQMTSLERTLKSGISGREVTDFDRTSMHRNREVIMRGVLSVTVISAVDLPAMDIMGKSDTFVVVKMMKTRTKKKTRVVNQSLNPIWNQTFDFAVEDALRDMLIVEVWDHDIFKKDFIGSCIMTLTRVIMEGEYADIFHLEGSKAGQLNLKLKWTPHPIYRSS
ncbi:Synaptotagmin-5 [Cocos nucifera]|uniref:Synaptotagmin-5 n=1 Tax=Cocos nucifera TaxID=13894 RepID=A0A8K0MVX6_COCNU|nr:Synaptotagmin-5 [Cocos nucifera]